MPPPPPAILSQLTCSWLTQLVDPQLQEGVGVVENHAGSEVKALTQKGNHYHMLEDVLGSNHEPRFDQSLYHVLTGSP